MATVARRHWPPSSSGPGLRVLSPETGVRLPLGVALRLARFRVQRNCSRRPAILRGLLLRTGRDDDSRSRCAGVFQPGGLDCFGAGGMACSNHSTGGGGDGPSAVASLYHDASSQIAVRFFDRRTHSIFSFIARGLFLGHRGTASRPSKGSSTPSGAKTREEIRAANTWEIVLTCERAPPPARRVDFPVSVENGEQGSW